MHSMIPPITDTQLLSYYYKDALEFPSNPVRISSITAAEFLLIQSSVPHRANYYPLLPSRLRHNWGITGLPSPVALGPIWDSRKHTRLGARRTDRLVIDLGPQFPSFVEFGSLAIAQIINEGLEPLYVASISRLEKELQKKLKARLRFLLKSGVQCVALDENIATIGVNLFAQFLERYETKQNPRNTLNDVLILGTAIALTAPLFTEDGLLRRFAAEIVDAPCHELPLGRLMIDFGVPSICDRRHPLESKGYVNRGWRILQKKA